MPLGGVAMHKGNPVPFLYEFWAVPTQFWRGYVMRRAILVVDPLNAAPWDALNPGPFLSDVGIPSTDMSSVEYSFIPPAGFSTLTALITTAVRAGVKGTVFSLAMQEIGGPLRYADNFIANFSRSTVNFNWPNGTIVVPFPAYVPPICTLRGATWIEGGGT
jgi:hypothetical protein